MLKQIVLGNLLLEIGKKISDFIITSAYYGYHKLMHHKLSVITIEDDWNLYTEYLNMLKEKQDKSLSHLVFKGFGNDVEGTGTNCKSDPKPIKVKFKGHTIKIQHVSPSFSKEEMLAKVSKRCQIRLSSYSPIEILLEYLLFNEKEKKKGEAYRWCYVHGFDKNESKQLGHFKDKTLLPPILKKGQLEDILEDYNKFLNSEDYFLARSIPYHRGYLFYGPPGTGKTSIANYLATVKGNGGTIYKLNAQALKTGNIELMLSKISRDNILLIEDIDCLYEGREPLHPDLPNFSDMLNALDNILAPKGLLLVITTNNVDTLDPALIRPGRIDRVFEFDLCDSYQIQKFLNRYYPDNDVVVSEGLSGRFTPAQIQGFLIQTNSANEFIMKLWSEKIPDDMPILQQPEL